MTGDEGVRRPAYVLPAIVASQFAGTSVWFAGNAVMDDLRREWRLPPEALGHATSAVQFGFIAGTLVFAVLALADRYSPRHVFFASALLSAAANLAVLGADGSFALLLASRFLTGLFLAGIYPIGMKIAAGWYREGLGRALGYLVGALVLGTAFPHALKALGQAWPWQHVVVGTSLLAAAGGMLMYGCVLDGPHLVRGTRLRVAGLVGVFASARFRASACGYFGHMWELYAFWAFVPIAIAARAEGANVAAWSFAVIAVGAAGCVGGGWISGRLGSAAVAAAQLFVSGLFCLLSPLLLTAPLPVMLAGLIVWGIVVVGDSPQFSALNAAAAPRDRVGSALTAANCIGFAITIVSIQLLTAAAARVPLAYLFLLLAPGPVLGLLAMRPLWRRQPPQALTGSRGSPP